MSWREIKSDDVLGYFTPAEQDMLQGILGKDDTLTPKIDSCVSMVRGFISAGANQLDAESDASIPDQLRPQTIAFIAWEWLSGFPALKPYKTDDRKTRADNAQKLFERVGSQEKDRPRVEIPDSALAKPAPVAAVSVPRPGRRVSTGGFDRMGSS